MQKRINVLQLRGIRRILGIDSTYLNQANTNDLVLRKTNAEMKKYKPNRNEIKLFSELVREKRIKLAGHILRSSEEDPPRPQASQVQTQLREQISRLANGGSQDRDRTG